MFLFIRSKFMYVVAKRHYEGKNFDVRDGLKKYPLSAQQLGTLCPRRASRGLRVTRIYIHDTC